jgi:hypothetical protein
VIDGSLKHPVSVLWVSGVGIGIGVEKLVGRVPIPTKTAIPRERVVLTCYGFIMVEGYDFCLILLWAR